MGACLGVIADADEVLGEPNGTSFVDADDDITDSTAESDAAISEEYALGDYGDALLS